MGASDEVGSRGSYSAYYWGNGRSCYPHSKIPVHLELFTGTTVLLAQTPEH